MAESAVKIAVRERPSKDKETIIEYNSNIKNILIANDRPFAFDYVFQSNVLQKDIFDALAQPLVKKTKDGYNCNIFAYGQTGTGKTYTMGLTHNLENECAGIIPRCLNEVFNIIQFPVHKISVSYIEIYNEKVFDMLSLNSSEQINVKGFKFNGGTKHEIISADEGLNFLIQGNQNRHVRPTKMNSQSSRSHAIFTIHIEQKTDSILAISMLNLIDLAGSEGVRRTGHQGIALSEGVNINQGLLSVGKVIQALNSGSKVIPYRDSILTSVLQESLNSNSYLTLLACISPENIDKTETLSTLRFAQNVKSLRNNPLINSIFLEYQNKKQRTPSKAITPLRTKNIYASSLKKDLKSAKAIRKFNSFCSPSNIRRIEVKRLNNTEIKKVKPLSFKEMFIQHEKKQHEQTIDHNHKRSIESRSSFTSLLNASSSTILEIPTISTNSPNVQEFVQNNDLTSKTVVTNYFQSLQQDIEKQFTKNPRENDSIEPTKNYTNIIWESVKNNVRDMLREELLFTFEKEKRTERKELSTEKCRNFVNCIASDHETRANQHNALNVEQYNEIDSESTRKSNRYLSNSNLICSSMENKIKEMIKKELITLVDDNEIFKTPKHNQTSIQPLQNLNFKVPYSNFETQEMEATSTFDTLQNPSLYKPRRSRRLSRHSSIKEEIEPSSTINSSSESLMVHPRKTRLSKSILIEKEYTNVRRSLRIEAQNIEKRCSLIINNVEQKRDQNKFEKHKIKKGQHSLPTTNKVISSYFNKVPSTEIIKNGRTKHQKAVLDLLNNGTIKELQILPHVGLKTAYQIITHRTLNGKFKTFDIVSKLPVWRGKSWERFKEANSL